MRRTLFESVTRPPLTEPAPAPTDPELAALAAEIKSAAGARLGRSLAIRHVDAGSCNACELEIHALSNAFYDIERFGFRFVASPRHADVLWSPVRSPGICERPCGALMTRCRRPNGSSPPAPARLTAAYTRGAMLAPTASPP